MKNLFPLVASILAGATVASPALAQDAFEDAKEYYAAVADGLNANNVKAMQALHAKGVVFVPSPGVALSKDDDIAGALGQFAAMSDQFDVKVRSVYESGDTLLVVADWTLAGKSSDGKPITMTGSTADVLKRSPDGKLLAVIDNPFGSALPVQ